MSLIGNVKYIKLYFKISPLIDTLQKECSMKLTTNVVIQILATVGQLVNQLSPVVPEKQRTLVLAVLAAVQGVVAAVAHYSNPDGTNASAAYVKPDSKVGS